MTVNTATARYRGLGKDGKGHVMTPSGAINAAYGYGARFEDAAGTNPEEMIAAAHAACFTMALSIALARAGHGEGNLNTLAAVTLAKDGDGFAITRSALKLTAMVPGIGAEDFARIAEEAKAGCPVSRLLNCDITLDHEMVEEEAGEEAGDEVE